MCRVVPGSLLPAQEGGEIAALLQGTRLHRTAWLSQHVVICHLPLWCGLFHGSKCWEGLVSHVLFEISSAREKVVVLRVVLFSKGFCVCQVLCNLPAVPGGANAVAKAPSGSVIFHQGPGL